MAAVTKEVKSRMEKYTWTAYKKGPELDGKYARVTEGDGRYEYEYDCCGFAYDVLDKSAKTAFNDLTEYAETNLGKKKSRNVCLSIERWNQFAKVGMQFCQNINCF